ncbi:phospholipase D-like domain-containing protein, partial [Dolichospermum sp. ST_sed3]|nr:phospholipase D-like domain-containing protein [Dolichospermum sp. ST_sed3]
YYGNNSSDDAIRALIDAAEQEIIFSQQDMFNMTVLPIGHSYALDQLVNALLRGVKIKVLQSDSTGNPVDGYGMLPAEKAYAGLVNTIEIRANRAKFQPANNQNLREYICQQIDYAAHRYSANWATWPDGAKIGNHAKMIIVDRSAFSIGSQNFYPSNLQEMTVAVFDQVAADYLIKNYWDFAWKASAPGKIACPNS